MTSKTKGGATLIGGSLALATITAMVGGDVGIWQGILALAAQVGAVTFVHGIRDTPFVNKK